MPFSPQSYTGQGIVQQTERSRVGELFGQGLAGLGEGLGKGIEKFALNKKAEKDKQEAIANKGKTLRHKLSGFGDVYGMEEKDWNSYLSNLGAPELEGLGENLIIRQAAELHKLKKEEGKQGVEIAGKQEARAQQKLEQESLDKTYAASELGGTA